MAYKLSMSDEVVEFIRSFSSIIETSTQSTNSSSRIYFMDNCFKETDDPNVFEVIGKIDLIESYCINNETKDNS